MPIARLWQTHTQLKQTNKQPPISTTLPSEETKACLKLTDMTEFSSIKGSSIRNCEIWDMNKEPDLFQFFDLFDVEFAAAAVEPKM